MKLGIVAIKNCVNRNCGKLWTFFGIRPKCYPVCYKFCLLGHYAEREIERDEYSWQLIIEMMVIHSGMALASNSMDQHTYSRIASLVIVELDCIQFDFIH